MCLFSYGQSGAGKTHTMQGGRAPDAQGIIPRSVFKARLTPTHPESAFPPLCRIFSALLEQQAMRGGSSRILIRRVNMHTFVKGAPYLSTSTVFANLMVQRPLIHQATRPSPEGYICGRQILEAVRQLKAEGWEYRLEASFIEVYNEVLRDLLADAPRRGDAGRLADGAIKHASDGNCWELGLFGYGCMRRGGAGCHADGPINTCPMVCLMAWGVTRWRSQVEKGGRTCKGPCSP